MRFASPPQRGRACPGPFHMTAAHSDASPSTTAVRARWTSGRTMLPALLPTRRQWRSPSWRFERSWMTMRVMPRVGSAACYMALVAAGIALPILTLPIMTRWLTP